MWLSPSHITIYVFSIPISPCNSLSSHSTTSLSSPITLPTYTLTPTSSYQHSETITFHSYSYSLLYFNTNYSFLILYSSVIIFIFHNFIMFKFHIKKEYFGTLKHWLVTFSISKSNGLFPIIPLKVSHS